MKSGITVNSITLTVMLTMLLNYAGGSFSGQKPRVLQGELAS